MNKSSWALLGLAITGASIACFAIATFDWVEWTCRVPGSEPSKPFGLGPGACFDFWLYRYQTLIGAAAALIAGVLAWRGAMRQVDKASDQVEMARAQVEQAREQTNQMRLQLPLVQQQAAAVRAEQIGKLIEDAEALERILPQIFEDYYLARGIVRDICAELKISSARDLSKYDLNMPVLDQLGRVRIGIAINKLGDSAVQCASHADKLAETAIMLRRTFYKQHIGGDLEHAGQILREFSLIHDEISKCESIWTGKGSTDVSQISALRRFVARTTPQITTTDRIAIEANLSRIKTDLGYKLDAATDDLLGAPIQLST